MTTYEELHAGDLVLGHADGKVWGVGRIDRSPTLAVTLVGDEGRVRVTGYPPSDTPVEVVERVDVSAERAAAQMFIDAGLGFEILREEWGP